MSFHLNVRNDAVDDPRLKVAGKLMCMAPEFVFGKMFKLWAYCYDKQTHLLARDIIDAITDFECFTDVIEKAELAELSDPERQVYRIKGLTGRIEWLGERRTASKKGGKARAAQVERNDAGEFVSSQTPAKREPNGSQEEAKREPTSSPSSSTSSSPSSSASSRKKKEELNLPAHPSGERGTGKSIATWEAYREAYQRQYGIPPVRNATINGQLTQLVKRLGEEESPLVAAFYLTHQDAFYVRNKHPVGLLLKDAEKMRTEWATGRRSTGIEARQIERKQATVNAFANLLAEAEEKEAGHG